MRCLLSLYLTGSSRLLSCLPTGQKHMVSFFFLPLALLSGLLAETSDRSEAVHLPPLQIWRQSRSHLTQQDKRKEKMGRVKKGE